MIGFAKRNLKLFFKDRTSVFFSLLGVLIIIGLYVLFLGDVLTQGIEVPNARFLMDSWVVAGLLAVASVTTTLGAFGIMVEDQAKKLSKDFISSPIKRRDIAGGYIMSSFLIGLIMTLLTLILAELYILSSGGTLLPLHTLLQVLGLILLTALTNTAIVLFIVSFLKSSNAFATASSLIGTLIGFLTGIYLPIGQLPDAVAWVVKLFPVSHAAVLFRQIMMQAPMEASFAGAPESALADFKEELGIVFQFGDMTVTPLMSICILAATALLFYALSVFVVSRKRK